MRSDRISYPGVVVAVCGLFGLIGVFAGWFEISYPTTTATVTERFKGTEDWSGVVAAVGGIAALLFGGAYMVLTTDRTIKTICAIGMAVGAAALLAGSILGMVRTDEAMASAVAQLDVSAVAVGTAPGLMLSLFTGLIAVFGAVLASLDFRGAGRRAPLRERPAAG